MAVRKYWRELCMIAMAYTIVFLFRRNEVLNSNIQDMLKNEVVKKEKEGVRKDEQAKFWRDAFITTAKFNKYLEKKKDTL